MTRAELERRVRALAEGQGHQPEDVNLTIRGDLTPVALVLYVADSEWAFLDNAASEEAACDAAWSQMIVRFCIRVERARRLLDAARAFDER